MKQYSTYLFVFIFSSIVLSTDAQTTLGLRLGVSFNSISNSNFYDSGDKKTKTGLAISVPLSFSLSEKISLQPEFTFIQKGAKVTDSGNGWEAKATFSESFIEIPVLIKYQKIEDGTGFYFGGGPSFGYWMSGKITEVYEDDAFGKDTETYEVDFNEDREDEYQRLEIGMYLGGGYMYSIGPGSIMADIRYGIDFNDFLKSDDNQPNDYEPTKNRSFIISLGYAIPLGND